MRLSIGIKSLQWRAVPEAQIKKDYNITNKHTVEIADFALLNRDNPSETATMLDMTQHIMRPDIGLVPGGEMATDYYTTTQNEEVRLV